MKRFIVILLLLIPVFSFAQERREKKEKDVVIIINVSELDKTIGSIIGFIQSEVKQFKTEAEENMDPETKKNFEDAKENFLYELKYTRDAIHQGWKQGWRAEEYTPPYKHK